MNGVRLVMLGLGGLAIVSCSGCIDGKSVSQRASKMRAFEEEIEALRRQLVDKDAAIQSQEQIIQALRDLEGERSLDTLVHVSSIEIERLSGGHDADGDGVDEAVKVYLRLRDRDGDTIKAAGSVHVRLWDLANPPEAALVGAVRLSPAELGPMWYGRLATYHYTITVPWAGGATRAAHETITVHVQFTDLLSGRPFEVRRAVMVRGAGPTTSAAP